MQEKLVGHTVLDPHLPPPHVQAPSPPMAGGGDGSLCGPWRPLVRGGGDGECHPRDAGGQRELRGSTESRTTKTYTREAKKKHPVSLVTGATRDMGSGWGSGQNGSEAVGLLSAPWASSKLSLAGSGETSEQGRAKLTAVSCRKPSLRTSPPERLGTLRGVHGDLP